MNKITQAEQNLSWAIALRFNLKYLYNLLKARWTVIAQVSLTTSDKRFTNITSKLLSPHQDKVRLYGCAFVSVCIHPHVFFYKATIYLKRAGGDECFLAQRGKMERRPYATLSLNRMKSKIHPSMWWGQSSTSTYDTSSKKKNTTKEKGEKRSVFI